MDKKVKNYLTMAVVFASAFAIYNIIVMLLFSGKNNIFWISYSAMTITFIINIAVMLRCFSKQDTEAIFMGIPLLSFTVFYFFAELFTSFVFMLFRAHASVKLTVAIQLIMLLLYIIFAAMALLTRQVVNDINTDVKQKVSIIKSLSVDVQMLEEQCMDAELKKELHKIAEAIRYSDPMYTDAVADLDNIIKGKVAELKMQCNSNNKGAAMEICYNLNAYIQERNKKLIISK